MQHDLWIMSAVIFMPTLFAVILLFVRKKDVEVMRWITLFGTAITLVLSLWLLIDWLNLLDVWLAHPQQTSLNARAAKDLEAYTTATESARPISDDLVSRYSWISAFNIEYYLGVDGISVPLIVLTTIIFLLSMIASWNIHRHVRGYCILLLLLETGVLGTFMALDFFLFFVFWEVMLLPMYFLIGIWGGPRREYAAVKFFLYTMLGSVFILIAILGFYFTDMRWFVPQGKVEQQALALKAKNPELTEDQAEAQVAINTFDIMVLHQAGKAARVYLSRLEAELKDKPGTDEELRAARRKAVVAMAAAGALPSVESIRRSHKKARDELEQQIEKIEKSLKDPKLPSGEKQKLEQEKKTLEVQVEDSRTKEAAEVAAAIVAVDSQIEASESNPFSFFSQTGQWIFFLMLFVGFAIKVPVFPFHTWLPDAHVEAPTPISMILAGILLKLGGYGILRIAYPICPWAAETLAWYLALFGIINIVYGAFAAMAQKDFKKLVAYSSISHMGYVILGIAVWQVASGAQYWSWGMNGAMYQMIAHGISSAGMFFLVGVIYDRAHHRNLDNFRGLFEPMPLYGGISALIFFAALGLPGLCGFVGEFMVVLATWNYSPVFAVIAAMTVVITAAYILWTLQRVYFGTNPAYKDYPDITLREIICVTPLCILAILLGVVPALVLYWMEPSVTGLVNQLAQLGR